MNTKEESELLKAYKKNKEGCCLFVNKLEEVIRENEFLMRHLDDLGNIDIKDLAEVMTVDSKVYSKYEQYYADELFIILDIILWKNSLSLGFYDRESELEFLSDSIENHLNSSKSKIKDYLIRLEAVGLYIIEAKERERRWNE